MIVSELIATLNKLPPETLIEYVIFSNGRTYYEKVLPEDFIYNDLNKTLIIRADWS